MKWQKIYFFTDQNMNIEKSLLGAILLEKQAIYEVVDMLKIQFFADKTHQIIYSCILELFNDDKPIDILTVSNKAEDKFKGSDLNYRWYITSLTSEVSTTSNIRTWAMLIIEKYYQKQIIEYGYKLQRIAQDNLTVDEIIDFVDTENTRIMTECFDISQVEDFESQLRHSVEEYEAREKAVRQNSIVGIKTPIFTLTKLTNGWQPGKLYCIAGRPGMGKSAFVISVLRQALKEKKAVMLSSLEMNYQSVVARILSGESDFALEKFLGGYLTSTEKAQLIIKARELSEMQCTIDDKASQSISYIKAKANILKRKNKLDLLIVDYLQLIHDESSKSRNDVIGEQTRALKILSRSLNIPVIILSQLNREVDKRENKRPQLSDLRESGSIEQDCDLVAFIFRAAFYGIETLYNGESSDHAGEIVIAKHREGQTGIVYFKHNYDLTNIYDYN